LSHQLPHPDRQHHDPLKEKFVPFNFLLMVLPALEVLVIHSYSNYQIDNPHDRINTFFRAAPTFLVADFMTAAIAAMLL
jgi:hypothetical protein